MASPEQHLQADLEWTTEDFLSAEPYPVPEVTDAMVSEFIEKATPQSAKGGSVIPGGPPNSDGGADGGEVALTGYPYPPPFNQHEVSRRTPATRIAQSARSSSSKAAGITSRLPPRSVGTASGRLVTASTRATVSRAAGRPTSSSCPGTVTAPRPSGSSRCANCSAARTGTSTATPAGCLRIWVRPS